MEGNRPKRLCTDRESDGVVSWNDFPLEIKEIILSNFRENSEQQILRFVCREWNTIIVSLCTHSSSIKDFNPYDTYFTIYEYAILNGPNMNLIQWLHSMGVSWDAYDCSVAAFHGSLKTIRYFHTNGCNCGYFHSMYAAIEGNRPNILSYLYSVGPRILEKKMWRLAIENENMRIIKWLYINECPWDEEVCAAAAENENPKFLKWLHKRGCPWDERTCESAVYAGCLETVEWLKGFTYLWNQYLVRIDQPFM